MDKDQNEPRRTLSGLWIWVLVLLLVIYPLSIGPAAILHKKCPQMRPAIESIYAPLTIAADRCQPLRRALEWYICDLLGIK